jgi:glycosyltransferase involved in cell wall biosynthesis
VAGLRARVAAGPWPWPGVGALQRRAAGGRRRAGDGGADGAGRRVAILIRTAYVGAGTVRTVLNLATYLARERDVELISVLRKEQEPFYPLPERVRVTTLYDLADGPSPAGRSLRRAAARLRLPSLLMHPQDATYRSFSPWTDYLLLRKIRSLSPGTVLITTRPTLNLFAAMFAPADVTTVGQEHLNIGSHKPGLLTAIRTYYPRLAAFVVLTQRDREEYAEFLGEDATVVAIPNAVPPLPGGMADPSSTVVIAAGRLVDQKGFDRLVDAFALVSGDHPSWELRIFGAGHQEDALRQRIRERGLDGRVRLMGHTRDMGREMEKASVYALSSRHEGFPMVLLEAMSKGLAVVAFDCPTGPRELIETGKDGILVPEGDVPAFAAALESVMSSEAERRRLGAGGIAKAAGYDVDSVGRQWDALLSDLTAGREAGRTDR